MTLKVFEAFSGVGAQVMALKNIGIPYESVGVAEVNEFSILSYAAIHTNGYAPPEVSEEEMQDYLKKLNIPLNDKGVRVKLKGKRLKALYNASKSISNVGDISKFAPRELADEIDLFTYSFPCQSISFAGLGHGLSRGSGTRSSLLWDCEKIIEEKKPKYLLMENVKALISKKYKYDFDRWCDLLEELGYNNHWKVLNAKDFGVPQNRERVFMLSIRKDLSSNYDFPDGFPLNNFIEDILEEKVTGNYYFSKEKVNQLILNDKKLYDNLYPRIKNVTFNSEQVSDFFKGGLNDILGIVNSEQLLGVDVHPFSKKLEFNSYSKKDISGCLIATNYKAPKTVALYQRPRGFNSGGFYEQVSPTLSSHSWHENNLLLSGFLKIRKLTPRECWRLMGFSDGDFNKAEKVVSNTQLYKQAGNSIVVPVLESIFTNLYGNGNLL